MVPFDWAVLLVSLTLAVTLIRRVLQYRPSSLRRIAVLGTYALSIWEVGRACEGIASDFAVKLAWERFAYLGVAALLPLQLLFVCTYTTGGLRWTRQQIALLAIIPCLTIALALTNDWHHLVWQSITRGTQSPSGELVFVYGPWFWVWVVHNYTMVLVTGMIVLRSVLRLPRFYRGQANALLIGGGISVAGNIAHLTGFSIGGLDIMPCVLILTTTIWLWNLSRNRFLDVMPIAREALVESMTDGVVVLDHTRRIVDLNPAAQRLLGSGSNCAIGQYADRALGRWPLLVAQLGEKADVSTELIPPEDDALYLEAQIHTLRGTDERVTGRLVVLRDISERKRADAHLHEMYARLQTEFSENEILRERLREETLRDPLTGLYNRRYLHESLGRELARATRDGLPVSLVMLDVDHFKSFNDRYGHNAGDTVLRRLGEMLHDATRDTDIVCRYGGEEFLVVLPGSAGITAHEWAEGWRLRFQDLDIAHGQELLSATFSAGIAAFPANGHSDDALLAAADHALYAAKREGRNRVVSAPVVPQRHAPPFPLLIADHVAPHAVIPERA